jgi:membrane protein required for beta-lactamase induction
MLSEEYNGSKIDELLDLTKENNRMLRSMHRRMIWSQIFSYIYWLIILGSLGWSYYYLQPYIAQSLDAYQTLTSSLSTMQDQSKSFPSDLQGLLEKVR